MSEEVRESYLSQSRRPLAALVFVLPLIVIYEVGTWHFHQDAAAGVERRIVAFTWVRQAFATLGATAWYIAPLAVVSVLLGWHVFAGYPWRLRWWTPAAMLVESAMLAVPLLGLMLVWSSRPEWLGAVGESLVGVGEVAWPSWAGMAVVGLGAGVYEELVFRLLAFAALAWLLGDVMKLRKGLVVVLTVAATSVAFAGYHYLGSEPFAWGSFWFRTMAGVWLGAVYLVRGFGVAAGSHAAYDVVLVAWIDGAAPS